MSTESLGFKVSDMSNEKENRPKSNLRPMTLAKLHLWIDGLTIETRLKEELKRMASQYPQQALSAFPKNYRTYLAKAQNNLKNKPQVKPEPVVELGDELPETDNLNDMPHNDEFDDF